LSLWCCWRFLPLFLVHQSGLALEAVGVVHDGQESRCGLHIVLCLICCERRYVPGFTSLSVDVVCGRCVWFCVVAGRSFFLLAGFSSKLRL
jgi:hypothetical protein